MLSILSIWRRIWKIWPLCLVYRRLIGLNTKKVIFSEPWDQVKSITVDDRVRGGASQSFFDQGHFHGNLDTTILGGAGFASQTLIPSTKVFPKVPYNLADYDGIEILAKFHDDKVYAFNLKNETVTQTPDGRNRSTVEFKVLFSSNSPTFHSWSSFKPYYRGKPSNGTLDPSDIQQFSVMCQSLFDKQSGPFSLQLLSISVIKQHPLVKLLFLE